MLIGRKSVDVLLGVDDREREGKRKGMEEEYSVLQSSMSSRAG
jgi:hypothetical protein